MSRSWSIRLPCSLLLIIAVNAAAAAAATSGSVASRAPLTASFSPPSAEVAAFCCKCSIINRVRSGKLLDGVLASGVL